MRNIRTQCCWMYIFWLQDDDNLTFIAWKVSKYGVFSGLYFPVFGLNTGNYGPEKTPHLDTFHAVIF